ncbi:MAG: YlxR family protein [Clostridia bacterium]|nr:YlxR family protein [Clostridia bacterium]
MPIKEKKIPNRKCLGCMESFPKKELIRLVRSPEGELSLDFTGKKSGRGAYICHNKTCFLKARKAKRFEKNLECEIPEDVYASLEAELENT